MEQAEFGEERSSISDPLDPEDETLIWSAGTFFDPSATERRKESFFVSVRWLQAVGEHKSTGGSSCLDSS